MKSKDELKKYFENGDKPTQEQFWEWQDSYWHKAEKLQNIIPLTGTEEDKPVTGKITTIAGLSIGKGDYTLIETAKGQIEDDGGSLGIMHEDEVKVAINPFEENSDEFIFNNTGFFSNKQHEPSTDNHYLQKGWVNTKIGGIYKIKGSVNDLDSLSEVTDPEVGDVYNVLSTGDIYVYVSDLDNTGIAGWDKLSGVVDVSNFISLEGTNEGSPITGLLEFTGGAGIDLGVDQYSILRTAKGQLNDNTATLSLRHEHQLKLIIDPSDFITDDFIFDAQGFYANKQYTPFSDDSFVQKKYVDDTISTNSGIPLTGTVEGSSVTGNIEMSANTSLIKKGGIDDSSDYSINFNEVTGVKIASNRGSSLIVNDNGFIADITIDETIHKYFRFSKAESGIVTNGDFKADFSGTNGGNLDQATISQFQGFRYERNSGKFAALSEGYVTTQNQTDLIMMNVDDGLYANKYYVPTTENYYVQKKYVDDKIAGDVSTIDLFGSGLVGSLRLEKHGNFGFVKLDTNGTLSANEIITISIPDTFGYSYKLYTYTVLGDNPEYIKITTDNVGIHFKNPKDTDLYFAIQDSFIFDLLILPSSD